MSEPQRAASEAKAPQYIDVPLQLRAQCELELRRRRQAAQPIAFAEGSSLVMDPKSVYHELWKPARYKIFYGGRGAAKDWSFSEVIIRRMAREPLRVLCTRELQNSVKDSVHHLLSRTIQRLNAGAHFEVLASTIKSRAGAETLYRGLRNNSQEVKSMEQLGIVWVAEAQNTSAQSLQDLRPTVREGGSEIWIGFNVTSEDAPIYQLVKHPFPGSIVHKVNYDSNPFMSKELRDEMEYDRARDYHTYEHVWLGMPAKLSNAVIFGGKYRVENFADDLWRQSNRLFFGADFGFASDPNTLMRMFILNNRLYIEYEAWGLGVELDDMEAFWAGGVGGTGKAYPGIPLAREWPVKCDSARPETISFMRRKGFNASAAEKWKGCVEDGIAHLKGFKEIIIHERCVHQQQEARLYSFKVDQKQIDPNTNAPMILPEIVDANNHCWDADRYALDGHIQRGGDLGIWERLGR